MLQIQVERGAESWQFFAFIFAAVVTFVLTVLDDFPWTPQQWRWKVLSKVVGFAVVASFTLGHSGARNRLVRLLIQFKKLG
jgi:hypothetical protein